MLLFKSQLLVYLTDPFSCTRRDVVDRAQPAVRPDEQTEAFCSHCPHPIVDRTKDRQDAPGEDSRSRNEDNGRNHGLNGPDSRGVHATTL